VQRIVSSVKTIPLWTGTILELLGLTFGFLILFFAETVPNLWMSFILLLASWFCFWFFSHCLAHYVVGKILGIDFRFYFVGKSSILKLNLPLISRFASHIPVLGIKINQKSFQSVAKKRRAAMFASGAVASMTFPLASVIYASFRLQTWMAIFLIVLTIVNVFFTVFFSLKVGDLWKTKKTLKMEA
jgi:hypothetical protein